MSVAATTHDRMLGSTRDLVAELSDCIRCRCNTRAISLARARCLAIAHAAQRTPHANNNFGPAIARPAGPVPTALV